MLALAVVLSSVISSSGMFYENQDGYGISKPAPPLENLVWHSGEPIQDFLQGNVYLLEFWSTWCLPCIDLIPHNNELASNHKDDGIDMIKSS